MTVLAAGGLDLLAGVAIFALAAFLLAFIALLVGRLVRPRLMNPDKGSAYECGEVPVGPAWGQFDLRFYVVALVFLVFDVEIALFYPWAVVYGGGAAGTGWAELSQGSSDAWVALRSVRWSALWDMLFFFGVVVVGFVYLWRFGYLDWVRSAAGHAASAAPSPGPAAGAASVHHGPRQSSRTAPATRPPKRAATQSGPDG
jgi:NADH-quinone oxidoreductase subunit A